MTDFFGVHWLPAVVAAVCVSLVALAGGLLTDVGAWYENLRKPTWRPPNWLFGPAWTLIFLLVGASGALAWENAPNARMRVLLSGLFALNGALNILWSALFFRMRRPDWAFLEVIALWLSIVALIVFTDGIATIAALLLAPYLVWVTFAGFLNLCIVRMNAPFGVGVEAHRTR